MSDSSPPIGLPHKETNRAETLRPPGMGGLVLDLRLRRDQGRPTWTPLAGIPVPRLSRLVIFDTAGYVEGIGRVPPLAAFPGAVVRLDALAAITGDPEHVGQTVPDRNGRAQVRRLAVAAMRDLAGTAIPEIADYFGQTDASTTRADAREGRKLWAALGSWPWSYLSAPGYRPEGEWWADRRLLIAWRAWATDAHAFELSDAA